MTEEQVKRSKIYSYFYGANTTFQQILLVFGILLIMFSSIAFTAKDAKISSLTEKNQELRQERSEAQNDEEKNKIDEKINKNIEKMKELKEDEPFSAKALDIGGKVVAVAAVLWILYKKIAFNSEGERIVDEEMYRKAEEAKIKALEKLNIISEQIERVDPVVLNGIAKTGFTVGGASTKAKGFFGNILRIISTYDKLVIGLIASVVFKFICNFLAGKGIPFFLLIIAMLALVGFVGYKMFLKYEKNSFVSPKTIDKLKKFDPNLVVKLGSDDVVRVSLPAITVYMFGYDQLYMYYQYYDIVTGEIFCEGIKEYFYEDIVGVTSKQETKKIYKRYGFLNLFMRSINYLRESIDVVSSGCTCSETYIVDVGNSLLDTQFTGMRNLIRQKKSER